MQPLTGLDSAFLALESGNTLLHVGAVIVLDPPEGRRSLFSPTTRFAQIRRLIEQRLHLVPEFRKRVVHVPFGLHHPVWVDDPEFDLDDHIRRVSLPAPGGDREMDELVAELMSHPLDPTKAMWEMAVVEGLATGRTAVVAKIHHAVLDGVSGASLLAAFLDVTARDRTMPFPIEPWNPAPLPSTGALLKYAASSLGGQRNAAGAMIREGIEAFVGITEENRRSGETDDGGPPPSPFNAPRTSLNAGVSSKRRFATVAVPLEDIRLVRRELGATFNDVVLSATGGAISRLLERRGERPERSLVALVPVSTRRDDASRALGNQLSGMLVSLGTTVADPVDRLRAVAEGARKAKAQERFAGGNLFANVAQVVAPAISSRAARWAGSLGLLDRLPPIFNVVVSTVPGPDFSLWLAGSKVVSVHPAGPVADGVGLNVTSMTYHGTVYFGLMGCRQLVPDVQELAILLDDAFGELTAAALDARGVAG